LSRLIDTDLIRHNKRIDENNAPPSSTCVASVASVAGVHDNVAAASPSQTTDGEDKAKVELPVLPCPWCDYKHAIEFDLGNHLLANHRGELLKLPIGKGSMDNRIDYAVEMVKSRMATQYDDDEDDVEENDSDDVD
jgi:hypothetical protein